MQLGNLGATPTCADTYLNAEGQAGYDFTSGWLRTQPREERHDGFFGQSFLGFCTHPTVFRHGWLHGKAAAARRRMIHVACGDSAHCWLGRRCCRSSVRARARHTSMLLRIKGGYGDSRKR